MFARPPLTALTDEERLLLQTFEPILGGHIDAILDEFYQGLINFSETRDLFHSPEHLQHARAMQRRHWMDWVFAARFEADYIRSVTAIGRAHERIGLRPKWYIEAYAQILTAVSRVVLTTYADDPDRQIQTLAAVQKAVFLDMGLVIEVYIEAVFTDPLTGLGNRRFLDNRLEEELRRAERHHRPLTVVFFDIDHFKQVNDTYGHPVGDKALVLVAQTLRHGIRREDKVARYGGEEFVTLLPETDPAEAFILTERLRDAVAAVVLPELDHPITVSAGVAVHVAGESATSLLARADLALYMAKSRGRNCSCLAPGPSDNPTTVFFG